MTMNLTEGESKPEELCPVCNEGHLRPHTSESGMEYRGQKTVLGMHFSYCDVCKSSRASNAQMNENARLMVAFKKRVDGLLIGAELRALRERLGLSQAEASRMFGSGPVPFSKYESDDVTQSEALDKLLRIVAEVPLAFEFLCKHIDQEPASSNAPE